MNKITHPWNWTSCKGYYMRPYSYLSAEWKKVAKLVDGFLQNRGKIQFEEIYAIYNPGIFHKFFFNS
jgi:hypothetical protein